MQGILHMHNTPGVTWKTKGQSARRPTKEPATRGPVDGQRGGIVVWGQGEWGEVSGGEGDRGDGGRGKQGRHFARAHRILDFSSNFFEILNTKNEQTIPGDFR